MAEYKQYNNVQLVGFESWIPQYEAYWYKPTGMLYLTSACDCSPCKYSTFCIHFSAFFAPLLSVLSAKGLKLVQHLDATAGRESGESEGRGWALNSRNYKYNRTNKT
jgi:hypothetical protein